MIKYMLRPLYLSVLLDGKKVGEIRKVKGGFQYFPKGSKNGGDVIPQLIDLKKQLEAQ